MTLVQVTRKSILNIPAMRRMEQEDDSSTSDEEKHSEHTSDEEDGEADTDGFSLEEIRKYLADKLHLGAAPKMDDQQNPHVLDGLDLDGIVQYIQEGRARNVVVMAGAGISTSAGIPDFRTPGTGLYHNLQKYNLPHPSAVFDIRYFEKNPAPFFLLAKELYPDNFVPTPSHFFIKLLQEKGLLLRHYTQNVDTLERVAGVRDEKLVEAHGTFHTARCIKCGKEYSQDWMKEKVFSDEIPYCTECSALVKPDIVFFGEDLPEKFFRCAEVDFRSCDLLIIMGSSLVVQPFASLIDRVSDTCPRVLINREKAGVATDLPSILSGRGLKFDSEGNYRDVYIEGDTDSVCRQLVDKLDWSQDFNQILHEKHKE